MIKSALVQNIKKRSLSYLEAKMKLKQMLEHERIDQKRQLNLLEWRAAPVIPDFRGDFVAEMDYISALPESKWFSLFSQIDSDYRKNERR